MSEELQAGDSLGGYVLEQRLGAGGFGAVWKARYEVTQRVVALKVLRMDAYSADTMRLRSEVELLAATASSRSPHVVKVLGGGTEPQPYIVMEFIDGVDLGKELERRKRIPQMETIRIGKAVAEALSALESVGIIHRDVKPTNVMIDVDGVVKLTDFGIAKIVGYDTITATSQMPMTMAYAAPEVWEGKATNRSDLYALGVVLFQCLAGRPPFTGSPAQLFREHTMKDPDFTLLPEGTVPALRDLLRDCLAKLEDDRPPDAASVAERLSEAERELNARLNDRAGSDLPAHEPQAFGPWLRREPHPTLPWAFLCIHETNGQKATVEVHFSDDIEYGSRLRKAVEVNPKLVPLGAERLLGTNRLVLRPGEAFVSPRPGQFLFWVAREDLLIRPGPTVVDEATLRKAASNLVSLAGTSAAEGLTLRLPTESLHLMSDGTILATRVGLSAAGDDGIGWLRTLPLDALSLTVVANAKSVAQMVVNPTSETGVARPSKEQLPEEGAQEQTSISGRLDIASLGTRHRPQPTSALRSESNAHTSRSESPHGPESVTRAPEAIVVRPSEDRAHSGGSPPNRGVILAFFIPTTAIVLVVATWIAVGCGAFTDEGERLDRSVQAERTATASLGVTSPTPLGLTATPTIGTPLVESRPRFPVLWTDDGQVRDPRVLFALAKVAKDVEILWDPPDPNNKPDARYDPAEAAKLLAAAGYESGRTLDGRQIVVTLQYPTSGALEGIAAELAKAWRTLGLTVETSPAERTQLAIMIRLAGGVTPSPTVAFTPRPPTAPQTATPPPNPTPTIVPGPWTGIWIGTDTEIVGDQRTFGLTLNFTQVGTNISGSYSLRLASAPTFLQSDTLAGVATGQSFEVHTGVTGQISQRYTFRGTVTGNTMSGEVFFYGEWQIGVFAASK